MVSDVTYVQDTDVCYAFVEYEDMDSVQSAIKVCIFPLRSILFCVDFPLYIFAF